MWIATPLAAATCPASANNPWRSMAEEVQTAQAAYDPNPSWKAKPLQEALDAQRRTKETAATAAQRAADAHEAQQRAERANKQFVEAREAERVAKAAVRELRGDES